LLFSHCFLSMVKLGWYRPACLYPNPNWLNTLKHIIVSSLLP
jgi:hypothetical protein